MCNLYSMMCSRAAVAAIARAMTDRSHNQPPMSGVYPNYAAPIVLRSADGTREMRDAAWGLPSSKKALLDAATKRADKLRAKGEHVDFAELLRLEPDKGTTNVRNTASTHWKPWLGPNHRRLVPFTSFSEPDQVWGSLQPIWFALAAERPLAFFAGVWKPDHTCVRKIKDGEITCDVFGFLTTDANADVGAYHSKAMPVILTQAAEWDLWMSDAPWAEVAHLQQPLPDGALRGVARGVRQDEVVPASCAVAHRYAVLPGFIVGLTGVCGRPARRGEYELVAEPLLPAVRPPLEDIVKIGAHGDHVGSRCHVDRKATGHRRERLRRMKGWAAA
jgi:putative SOS response-associated peptidase YedK